MWPGQVSNPGPLTYESGAISTALRGVATTFQTKILATITSDFRKQMLILKSFNSVFNVKLVI